MDQYQRQEPQEETPGNQPPTPDESIVTESDIVPQSEPTVEPTAESEPATEPEPGPVVQPEASAPAGSPADPKPTLTEAPVSTTTTPVSPADSEPRNFLAAFLLTITFGYYGLNQVYLGNKTQGWVRFALAIVAFPLSIVLVGFIIMAVLGVWAIVDFFKIYLGKRVDSNGVPLATGSRDSVWAKFIFIAAIAGAALYIILFIIGFAFGVFANIQNKAMYDDPSYYYDSSTYRTN